MPHSGMPGPPFGPAFLQHQNVVGCNVEVVAVDLARHVVVVLEGDHLAAMLEHNRCSAAEGFITHPRGARLPFSTAVRAFAKSDRTAGE